MEKRQAGYPSLNEGCGRAKGRDEVRAVMASGRQHLHDLGRLRIERNRAARHARCAVMFR